jgi:hypothetical protein
VSSLWRIDVTLSGRAGLVEHPLNLGYYHLDGGDIVAASGNNYVRILIAGFHKFQVHGPHGGQILVNHLCTTTGITSSAGPMPLITGGSFLSTALPKPSRPHTPAL